MSAESIIRRLDSVETVLKTNLVQELIKEGSTVANAQFGGMTTVTPNQKGFSISGTTAIIAEFGAGLATDTAHPFASNMSKDVPIAVGSYSKEHQGEFFKTGYKYWHFESTKMDRVLPRRGMYKGMEHMRQNLQKIAKRLLEK